MSLHPWGATGGLVSGVIVVVVEEEEALLLAVLVLLLVGVMTVEVAELLDIANCLVVWKVPVVGAVKTLVRATCTVREDQSKFLICISNAEGFAPVPT